MAKKPKQENLEGMEHLPRIPSLHKIASSLADVREKANELHTTEKGLVQRALDLMQKHERTIYKAHGIELIRVPGGDKLRVRLREDGESDQEAGDEGGEE